MSWKVTLASAARKQFRRVPGRDRDRLSAALGETEADPWAGDIVHLRGQPTAWRRRVGDWRVLFDILHEDGVVLTADIRRRTSTTCRR
ncbi:MAG: type II toxin-antitoxin system RelE/ParE family toxin [Planctomycetes bacterium]|nr:type II toxin-antitoxin system RelE/ParE family toxin [Planctomycetota bacterium]